MHTVKPVATGGAIRDNDQGRRESVNSPTTRDGFSAPTSEPPLVNTPIGIELRLSSTALDPYAQERTCEQIGRAHV